MAPVGLVALNIICCASDTGPSSGEADKAGRGLLLLPGLVITWMRVSQKKEIRLWIALEQLKVKCPVTQEP
jgi:hypothetical protein